MFKWCKQRGVDDYNPLTTLFYKTLLVLRFCSDRSKINVEIRLNTLDRLLHFHFIFIPNLFLQQKTFHKETNSLRNKAH